MNTLALFPALLSYQQVAPFIIRSVLGVTLVFFGIRKIRGKGDSSGSNSRTYGTAEIVVGIFLVVGLFTQVAALLNAIILVFKLWFKGTERKLLSDGVNYYILLFAMALSLLFTAPGSWAIDSLL